MSHISKSILTLYTLLKNYTDTYIYIKLHTIQIIIFKLLGSRHSSYTSHQSRLSYTSHGDLLGGLGKAQTKEARLRGRSASRNQSITSQPHAYPLPRQDSSLASRPLREYVSLYLLFGYSIICHLS